jgi:hypothetical protein
MARVMPRTLLPLRATVCLMGWLILISKVHHGLGVLRGRQPSVPRGGSLTLSHCERAGLYPACRKQRFMGQVVRARGVTYAVPSIQIERQRFSV